MSTDVYRPTAPQAQQGCGGIGTVCRAKCGCCRQELILADLDTAVVSLLAVDWRLDDDYGWVCDRCWGALHNVHPAVVDEALPLPRPHRNMPPPGRPDSFP